MTKFVVYIFYSKLKNRYYIGHTSDLQERIFRHRNSGSKSTKFANDWQVIYKEEYNSKSEAYKREVCIKKMKSRKYIEELIKKT